MAREVSCIFNGGLSTEVSARIGAQIPGKPGRAGGAGRSRVLGVIVASWLPETIFEIALRPGLFAPGALHVHEKTRFRSRQRLFSPVRVPGSRVVMAS